MKEYQYLDKTTFGGTPAAIYLVDRLNELKNPRLNQKVGRRIDEIRSMIKELEQANTFGVLSAHTVSSMIDGMIQRTEKAKDSLLELSHFPVDQLVADLMANVMRGSIKSLTRRSSAASILEKKQKGAYSRIVESLRRTEGGDAILDISDRTTETILITVQNDIQIHPVQISDFSDPITAESLCDKSRQKLARKKKICHLY